MNVVDRQILEFCLDEFQLLKPLANAIASGTLYRHVKRFVRLAWLTKDGNLYRTTDAGRRQLVAVATGRSWDALTRIYPPLAMAPTPVHRALIELILAAMVARQHEIRPDRHPFFVAFGSTLRWKTSLGRFVCYAVGLDPAVQIVDCGSEAGRSLTFRRGSDGTLVSKRALLETSFVVLDEYHTADRRVRGTLGIFLGGRLVMPVENEQINVRPVPMLTLNPKDAPTLEGRLGLSAPLIRRALLANLDAVPLPDLATVGERAIDAARAHQPLALAAPIGDVQGSHDVIVDLVRGVLMPSAHERLDVEIVVNLCAGMTALIPEPVPAIAQVLHGVGILAETLGWARPGWIGVVSDFGRGTNRPSVGTLALVSVGPPETLPANAVKDPTSRPAISVVVPPRPTRRRTSVPELDLSDELRARLIWFAMETQQDIEVALTTLLDFFLEWREAGSTIETLATILGLGQELELADVEVDTLHGFLEIRAQLRKENCDYEDVPEALRLIRMLQALPFAWTWEQAEIAMQALGTMLEADIDLAGVTEFLELHRQLGALGFDETAAVAVAEALARAGATGDRRDAVVKALVEVAALQTDIKNLEDDRQRLEVTVNELVATEQRWQTSVQQHREHIARLQGEAAQLKETRDHLQAECDEAAGSLAVAKALRAFLMGRTTEAESLWTSLDGLLSWRKRGGRVDDSLGQMLTETIHRKIVEFLQKLIQDLPRK
jgi:hypothetical protein